MRVGAVDLKASGWEKQKGRSEELRACGKGKREREEDELTWGLVVREVRNQNL